MIKNEQNRLPKILFITSSEFSNIKIVLKICALVNKNSWLFFQHLLDLPAQAPSTGLPT